MKTICNESVDSLFKNKKQSIAFIGIADADYTYKRGIENLGKLSLPGVGRQLREAILKETIGLLAMSVCYGRPDQIKERPGSQNSGAVDSVVQDS